MNTPWNLPDGVSMNDIDPPEEEEDLKECNECGREFPSNDLISGQCRECFYYE